MNIDKIEKLLESCWEFFPYQSDYLLFRLVYENASDIYISMANKRVEYKSNGFHYKIEDKSSQFSFFMIKAYSEIDMKKVFDCGRSNFTYQALISNITFRCQINKDFLIMRVINSAKLEHSQWENIINKTFLKANLYKHLSIKDDAIKINKI